MEIIANIVILWSSPPIVRAEQQSDDKKVDSASPVSALPACYNVTALLVADSLSPWKHFLWQPVIPALHVMPTDRNKVEELEELEDVWDLRPDIFDIWLKNINPSDSVGAGGGWLAWSQDIRPLSIIWPDKGQELQETN